MTILVRQLRCPQLMTDHPNLPDFTSMLALDIEKETGKPFNKGRLHSERHKLCTWLTGSRVQL